MHSPLIAGVDIGGSHITTSLVNLATRSILKSSQHRELVDPNGSAEDIIKDWCNAINNSLNGINVHIDKLGIAMPGPFDYELGISQIKGVEKFESLFGLNVKKLLSIELKIPIENIRMMNDAACFLQGEIFSGSARGSESAIGLTLGTGLGTARYQGSLAEDANLWCMPFLDGYAEEYLSTRWFLKRYKELTGKTTDNVKCLVDLYNMDVLVNQCFEEFGMHLSQFLLNFIANDKPEVIVLGGSISKAYPLFKKEVQEGLTQKGVHTSIYPSFQNEDSALIGAASLWQT